MYVIQCSLACGKLFTGEVTGKTIIINVICIELVLTRLQSKGLQTRNKNTVDDR